MKRAFLVPRATFVLAGLCLCVLAGCREADVRTERTVHRLRAIAAAYLEIAAARGSGPRDRQQLSEQLSNCLAAVAAMQATGDDSVEDLFASDRDGQPFAIEYGHAVDLSANAPVIVAERVGTDGERYVALASGNVISQSGDGPVSLAPVER